MPPPSIVFPRPRAYRPAVDAWGHPLSGSPGGESNPMPALSGRCSMDFRGQRTRVARRGGTCSSQPAIPNHNPFVGHEPSPPRHTPLRVGEGPGVRACRPMRWSHSVVPAGWLRCNERRTRPAVQALVGGGSVPADRVADPSADALQCVPTDRSPVAQCPPVAGPLPPDPSLLVPLSSPLRLSPVLTCPTGVLRTLHLCTGVTPYGACRSLDIPS
jgi:hypothetical protein